MIKDCEKIIEKIKEKIKEYIADGEKITEKIKEKIKEYIADGEKITEKIKEKIQEFIADGENWIEKIKEFIKEFIADGENWIEKIKGFIIQNGDKDIILENIKEFIIQNPEYVIWLHGFGWFLYLLLHYIFYRYNKPKFSFLAFVISIVQQILLIFILTFSIYMINTQDFITIHDNKSLQYLCVLIGFRLIFWIYVHKIQKYGVKKTLFNSLLLISSFYLLRLNLIYSIPFILPLTFNQLALNVLTSRLNLIVYITEDILNLKIWSSVQSILGAISDSLKIIKTYFYNENVFKDLLRAAIPLKTAYAQGPDLEITKQKESIKEKAVITFNMNYDQKNHLYKIDFSAQELVILKHLTFLKANPDLYIMVSPKGQEVFPTKLNAVLFEYSGMDPGVVFLPRLDLIDSSVQVPLYKYLPENENIVIENSEEKVVLVIHQTFCSDKYTGETPNVLSSKDIFVREKYLEPPFTEFWEDNKVFKVRYSVQNNKIYENYKPGLPNRVKPGEFCIKESRYSKNVLPLDLYVQGKPSVLSELGYSNSNCFHNKHYKSVKEWQRLYHEAQYQNMEITQARHEIEKKALNAWNGINDPNFNERLSQSKKYHVIPSGTSAAQANQMISNWRS